MSWWELFFCLKGSKNFSIPEPGEAPGLKSMGFPAPEFLEPFVGGFEIIAGFLILIGLFTRAGAFITLFIMSVAIIITKIPIGLGESFGPFVLRDLSNYGFWSMAHEMRTDFAMCLGSLYLIIRGGGGWSVDLSYIKK